MALGETALLRSGTQLWNWPLGVFPLFLKRTGDVLSTFSVSYFGGVFVWLGSLLAGDFANITEIPKGLPSYFGQFQTNLHNTCTFQGV